MKEPFTQIPNRLLDSKLLNVYDKAVFCILARFNPSFPSYETISETLSISRDTVWKSIKKLERLDIIRIEKRKTSQGKGNVYFTFLKPNPNEGVVCHTDPLSPPHRLGVVRQADCNKTKGEIRTLNKKRDLKTSYELTPEKEGSAVPMKDLFDTFLKRMPRAGE